MNIMRIDMPAPRNITFFNWWLSISAFYAAVWFIGGDEGIISSYYSSEIYSFNSNPSSIFELYWISTN